MTKICIGIGAVLSTITVIVSWIKAKRFPSLYTVVVLTTICIGIPFAVLAILTGFFRWPPIDIEEIRWILGIGGIALLWIALDQLRRELSPKIK